MQTLKCIDVNRKACFPAHFTRGSDSNGTISYAKPNSHQAFAMASTPRRALNDALEYVRKDDTLVVWRLDRLGRSLMHLIEVINGLHERKIGFKSLVDAIDTQTATGQFFFHVTGAFAELERNLIRERTRAGLKAARARGRSGGQPKAIDQKTFKMALEIYNSKTTTVGEMCKRLGIAKRTFYRHLELHNQQQ